MQGWFLVLPSSSRCFELSQHLDGWVWKALRTRPISHVCPSARAAVTNWVVQMIRNVFSHILEALSPRSRCLWSHAPSAVSSEGHFLAPSCLLVIPGSPWCFLACDSIIPLSPFLVAIFLFVSLSPCLSNPTLEIQHLTALCPQRHYLQIKPRSQALGIRTRTDVLGGHSSTYHFYLLIRIPLSFGQILAFRRMNSALGWTGGQVTQEWPLFWPLVIGLDVGTFV